MRLLNTHYYLSAMLLSGSDPNFEIRLSNLGEYKLYVRSPYSHYGLTGQKVTDYPIATLSPDTWHDQNPSDTIAEQ